MAISTRSSVALPWPALRERRQRLSGPARSRSAACAVATTRTSGCQARGSKGSDMPFSRTGSSRGQARTGCSGDRTRARAAQDREARESASCTRPRGALSRLPTGRLSAGRPPTGPADADQPAAPGGLLPGTGRRKGLARRAPRHRPVPHESSAAARTSTCAGSVGHTGLSRAPGRGGALELEVGAVAERTTTVHRQPRIVARAAPGSAR